LAYGLPDEILEAGMCLVTGVIHTLSADFSLWKEEIRPSQPVWPESSGGQDTLRRIFNHCGETRRPGFWLEEKFDVSRRKPYPSAVDHEWAIDPVLHELILPERKRQQREMIEAINRVCHVIQRSRNRTNSSDV
jgi:hypothetical protein